MITISRIQWEISRTIKITTTVMTAIMMMIMMMMMYLVFTYYLTACSRQVAVDAAAVVADASS